MPSSQSEAGPLLRWPGGKRRLARRILELFPLSYARYFEPFVGAGAVFHALKPDVAYLGDLNLPLINFYRQIQCCPEQVVEYVQAYGDSIDAQRYYELRDEFNSSDSAVATAAQFLALNMTCFNGIWRVNRYGDFNVPFGSRGCLKRANDEQINGLSSLLQGVTLFHGDFEDCVDQAARGDLVYLDPPYPAVNSRESFSRYTDAGFNVDRQKDVARTFSSLKDKGCFVACSQPDAPLIRELYDGEHFHVIEARRTLRARGEHISVRELVITSY